MTDHNMTEQWHEDLEDETYPPEMYEPEDYDYIADEDYDEDYPIGMDDNPFDCDDEPHDMTDVEADADTLRNCGWGTDEDYGYYGDGEW